MRGIRGSNLRIKLKLNYEEIARGVTKSIKVKKYIPCSTCHGSGAKDKGSVQTCSTCGGTGQVRRVQNTFLGQMQTVTTCPACNGHHFGFPGELTEAVARMCPDHKRQADRLTKARLARAEASNPDGWGALGVACERLERPHLPNGLLSKLAGAEEAMF